MKIAALIVRILLGLAFVLFGLNAFTGFMNPKEMPPMPQHALDFNMALMASGYFKVIGAFQLAGGLFLLTGRYAPLGLALLWPVLVNILCFHAFLFNDGWQPGVFCTLLAAFLTYYYRDAFMGLLRPYSTSEASSTFPVR